MKKLVSALLSFLIIQSACIANLELEDLKSPKENFYRLGTTDNPEIKYDFEIQPEIKPAVKKDITVKDVQDITYADLSIKKMAMEISKTLEIDYSDMQADLSLLWQGAATRSDTIKFAIYKLSNPDKDKPDNNAVKKVLTTIAGMSTFIGAGTGNPVLASAALIGGNTLGIMSQDTKALNYKYTRVNDADMIILVRKIDELQQKVVDAYYDYVTSRLFLDKTTEMVKIRYENYNSSQNSSKEVILVLDAYYRDAVDNQMKAKNNYYDKRAKLEQLVGSDIFKQFEQKFDEKISKNK